MLSPFVDVKKNSDSSEKSRQSPPRLMTSPRLFRGSRSRPGRTRALAVAISVDTGRLVVELARVLRRDDDQLLVHLHRHRLSRQDVERHRHEVVAVAPGVEPDR